MNQENQTAESQSTVSSEQSTVSTTTPSTVHRSPNSFLVILLSILLFISVAIAGFFAYQTQKLVNELRVMSGELKQTQTPTPVASAKPTTDPTAGWKIYKLSELNLSLKLPPSLSNLGNWEIENLSGDTGNNICFKLLSKNSFLINTVLAGGVGICDGEFFRINSNSIDYSAGRGGVFGDISGYRKSNGQYYPGIKVYPDQTPIPSDLVSEVTNKNGLTYIKMIGKDSTEGEWRGPIGGTPGSGHLGALILTKNAQYPGITVSIDLSDNMTTELFDQILSTFKFTD